MPLRKKHKLPTRCRTLISAEQQRPGSLAQRAIEEWERNLCENKAVAILERMQTGRPALIKKDGGEMLIAIVLDRPLAEAQALVDTPDAFIQALTTIIQDKKNHPVIAQTQATR